MASHIERRKFLATLGGAAASLAGSPFAVARQAAMPVIGFVNAGPTKVDPHIAAIGPTQLRKGLRERRDAKLRRRIVFVEPDEHADAAHALGLRARRERPSRRRAAERGQQFSSFDVACHVTLRLGSFMQWRDDITLPSRGL